MTAASLNPPLRLRFAPSPTGDLHVGGLRTALFNYLLKLKFGGSLILRLEDTDPEREAPGSTERLIDDLAWAGIVFDEGIHEGGASAPYRQSERIDLHREALKELLERGAVYRCWCTSERLQELREQAKRAGAPPRYDRRCRKLDPSERYVLERGSLPCVYRLATPETGTVAFDDLVRGGMSFDLRHLDDPILIRSDGTPTSILAGAIDDHRMGVTAIIRGEEWLPSAPYQYLIRQALNWQQPAMGHLPLLLSEDRSKLSKRHSGSTVAQLRKEGYLPEAVCRHLVALGRSNLPPNQGWDIASLADMFDFHAYGRADAVFSLAGLTADNARFIRQMPQSDLITRMEPFIEKIVPQAIDWKPDRLAQAVDLFRQDAETLRGLVEHISALITPSLQSHSILLDYPQAPRLMELLSSRLKALDSWDSAGIKIRIVEAGKELNIKGKELFLPIRLALTGSKHGPELPRIAEFLGREETLQRLARI